MSAMEEFMQPIFAIIAATMFGLSTASAQELKPAAAPAAAEPTLPRLGEIMSVQQMRHIKLWFAGRSANWGLADY